jgi:hypothetical protein
MNAQKSWIAFCAGLLLILVVACRKHASESEVIVEIPAGFNGNFQLEMGVKEAPPLEKRGDAFLVAVPKSGSLSTSTILTDPRIVFKNASDGDVWGYSHSTFTTGDGIPVSGRIEFFVGTKQDYEAQENKKNQSGGFSTPSQVVLASVEGRRLTRRDCANSGRIQHRIALHVAGSGLSILGKRRLSQQTRLCLLVHPVCIA